MKIVYEDKNQIAVYKPAGLATQTARLGEKDLVSEVKNYISRQSASSQFFLGLINRLDQPVEGIVLFGKNERATAILSTQMQTGKMKKYYYAVVYGQMENAKGTLIDYLKKDNRSNLSQVVSKNSAMAKKAMLEYEVLAQEEEMQLLKIHLLTGRHHQIRVQFSHRGHPLMGDRKYGLEKSMVLSDKMQIKTPALCAVALEWEDIDKKTPISIRIDSQQKIIQDLEIRGNKDEWRLK